MISKILLKNVLIPLITILSFLSTALFAGGRYRNTPKEHGFEARLAKIDASLVPVFKAATAAMDEENLKRADSLYSIVYEKAPTFDPAIRRLGSMKVQLREIVKGLELCEKAVSIDPNSDNLITLASSLVASGGDGVAPPTNLNRAMEVLKQGENLKGADKYEYTVLQAQIALQQNQLESFVWLSKKLVEKHPDQTYSHYFRAIAAANQEDWKLAESEILLAEKLGLPESTVTNFLTSGVYEKAHEVNYTKSFLWIFASWLAGLGLLYLLGVLLSNYTLRTVEQQIKSNSIANGSGLRTCYRGLINVAGVYYYLSLPVVLLLVVLLVVGIFYLFLTIGRIPIQLMLILLVGGCVTIFGMVRSLLLKVNSEDPGRELKESEAPALFSLTKEIATEMGTRPIDEIRITPETDLAVYEKGSWREKANDKGKRILILGTGVLKDFKQDDFKAVLAHEYGHFSHRDTAGGDIALRVRRDMHKYVHALYMDGQTVWWNLAFQFLRVYDFIFRRISNGATRLQEILADRVAAQTCGAVAFENGLTHVIKRQVEFVKLAKIEIEDAKKIQRPFNNLYDLAEPSSNTAIEDEVAKIINRETTLDDTHPSPVDRFRYVKGLGREKANEQNRYVSELFSDWNSITKEMTAIIEESWKNQE